MAKYATNASSAMLLLNLIQVTESISGSVVPLAMFLITVKYLYQSSFDDVSHPGVEGVEMPTMQREEKRTA